MRALEEATSSASGVTLQVSPTETRVVVRGELGHADWKLVLSACDIAKRNNNALDDVPPKCAAMALRALAKSTGPIGGGSYSPKEA